MQSSNISTNNKNRRFLCSWLTVWVLAEATAAVFSSEGDKKSYKCDSFTYETEKIRRENTDFFILYRLFYSVH